jgi:hypothetical protein
MRNLFTKSASNSAPRLNCSPGMTAVVEKPTLVSLIRLSFPPTRGPAAYGRSSVGVQTRTASPPNVFA